MLDRFVRFVERMVLLSKKTLTNQIFTVFAKISAQLPENILKIVSN
jgi:hypothetical protein